MGVRAVEKMDGSSMLTGDPVALRYLMTETIFGIGEPLDATPEDTTPQFSYYGGNRRHFLFLTHDPQNKWMSAAALDAFSKTLGALKLSADDVAVLNMAAFPVVPAVADLVAFFKPKVIVALGATLSGAPSEGVEVFNTHSFDEMLVDAEKKRAFWTTVKTLLI